MRATIEAITAMRKGAAGEMTSLAKLVFDRVGIDIVIIIEAGLLRRSVDVTAVGRGCVSFLTISEPTGNQNHL